MVMIRGFETLPGPKCEDQDFKRETCGILGLDWGSLDEEFDVVVSVGWQLQPGGLCLCLCWCGRRRRVKTLKVVFVCCLGRVPVGEDRTDTNIIYGCS